MLRFQIATRVLVLLTNILPFLAHQQRTPSVRIAPPYVHRARIQEDCVVDPQTVFVQVVFALLMMPFDFLLHLLMLVSGVWCHV